MADKSSGNGRGIGGMVDAPGSRDDNSITELSPGKAPPDAVPPRHSDDSVVAGMLSTGDVVMSNPGDTHDEGGVTAKVVVVTDESPPGDDSCSAVTELISGEQLAARVTAEQEAFVTEDLIPKDATPEPRLSRMVPQWMTWAAGFAGVILTLVVLAKVGCGS